MKEKEPVDYGNAKVFGCSDKIVFGDWKDLKQILEDNSERIEDAVIENDCRNRLSQFLHKTVAQKRVSCNNLLGNLKVCY